jgi:hypothetical protein
MNLKIKSAQSFRYAHINKMYPVCIFCSYIYKYLHNIPHCNNEILRQGSVETWLISPTKWARLDALKPDATILVPSAAALPAPLPGELRHPLLFCYPRSLAVSFSQLIWPRKKIVSVIR